MDFNFTEDQIMFQETVREFLKAEYTTDKIRELWETESRRSPEIWAKLAEIGIMGLMVPEEYDGMGMSEVDLCLLLEEMGMAAFAEPIVSTVVGTKLLVDLSDKSLAQEWLPKVAAGEAIFAVQHAQSPFIQDAHVADLLILQHSQELHAVPRDKVELIRQDASDHSNCLFSVNWKPSADTRIASGQEAAKLNDEALDRGAFATAAQLLGIGQQLIYEARDYALERKQFGVLIGTFQAIKHHIATCQVKVEYARPVVYRAAYSVANASRNRSINVSMAKLQASEAALASAKVGIQVHGAIGYTWEEDLHIWMRRAWSLDLAWGSRPFHRERVAKVVIDEAVPTAALGESWLA